jgi:hypothetical protein
VVRLRHFRAYVGYAFWFYQDDPFPLMQKETGRAAHSKTGGTDLFDTFFRVPRALQFADINDLPNMVRIVHADVRNG